MASIRKPDSDIVFCVLILAFYVVFSQVEAYECFYDSNCTSSHYCCVRKYPENWVCRSNCIGETCILHSDCARPRGEFCCFGIGRCATTCIGKSCISHLGCAKGESCCGSDKKCAANCTGKFCSPGYSDCGIGECCGFDNKCKTGGCDVKSPLPGWIVAIIVFVVIFFVVIPAPILSYIYCCTSEASSRSDHDGPVTTELVNTVQPQGSDNDLRA